jgi:hypothetical protein
MVIELNGKYEIDGTIWDNPVLEPLKSQPVLCWIFEDQEPNLNNTVIAFRVTSGKNERSFNLDFKVAEYSFKKGDTQDAAVLVQRIINRMNDFKLQTNDNSGDI